MKLSLYPYRLEFKFPFKIAHGTRTGTDVVFVKIEHKNHVGWGEATLPPYLPETQTSVIDFCTQFAREYANHGLHDWVAGLSNVQTNMSAKAALDMALWNLKANLEGKSIAGLLGIAFTEFPLSTYTIGVSGFEEMQQKIAEATALGFRIFKLKLNGEKDEEVIRNFKKLSSAQFAVDVNQGWKTVEETLANIKWLKKEGCILVEQPLPKDMLAEMRDVKRKSTLPVYADESCQRLSDIGKLRDCFHGINIKLMKCGGITEAYQMILRARANGLKVLIGCMSESTIGCATAAQLTPMADFADLDGPFLIKNDPFDGIEIRQGQIKLKALRQKINIPPQPLL